MEHSLLLGKTRSLDEVVPEQALRNVFAAIEPPSRSEGFEQMIEVRPFGTDAEPFTEAERRRQATKPRAGGARYISTSPGPAS